MKLLSRPHNSNLYSKLHNSKLRNISQFQIQLCRIYILYIFFVFVFCFHNNFIDLTITKYSYYLTGSFVFCTMMIFTLICQLFSCQKSLGKFCHKQKKGSINLIFIFLGMMVFWGIGLLFCTNPLESFLGSSYKCTGLLVYLLGILSVCFLGCFLRWNKYMSCFFVITSFLICQLQILNRWEIDPLNMYINLLWYEHPQFISTLGNTNYNGAFDCLIIGILMVLFFQCPNFKKLLVYGFCLCVAFAGGICCASDVVFICIALAFVILAGFSCLTPMKWFRLWIMMILFTIPCGIFPYFFHNREEELFIWDITAIIFEGSYFKYQLIAVFGFGVFLFLFFRLLNKYRNSLFLLYKIVLCTGMWIGLCSFTLANSTIYADNLSFLSGFQIDGTWGNDRGDLWQRFMTLFIQAPIGNKLFGFGFNNVFPALETIGLGIRAEEQIVDAHNIYFNTLITSGIIGCLFWIVIFGTLLYKSALLIQQKKDHGVYTLVGLLCILTQGLVIGPQIITTPIILTELGIFYSLLYNPNHHNTGF